MTMRPSNLSFNKAQGFTLIEVMLVIVIIAIVTSLAVMNVGGIEQRQVMQARELLLLNLAKIRNAANDQGRILGLVILPATDVNPAEYQVVELVEKKSNQPQEQNTLTTSPEYEWQVAKDFKKQPLPEHSSLMIQSLDNTTPLDALKTSQQFLPTIIWLGNGEMLPVQLQWYNQQQPLGAAIELNHLGQIKQDDAS